MRRSRFSEEQIIGILKEHQAGLSAAELGRKPGISDATFYKWRSKYGGMEESEAKRLKRLKRLEGEADPAAFQWKDAPSNERQAEEALGRGHDGRIHAARDAWKKLLRPGARLVCPTPAPFSRTQPNRATGSGASAVPVETGPSPWSGREPAKARDAGRLPVGAA